MLSCTGTNQSSQTADRQDLGFTVLVSSNSSPQQPTPGPVVPKLSILALGILNTLLHPLHCTGLAIHRIQIGPERKKQMQTVGSTHYLLIYNKKENEKVPKFGPTFVQSWVAGSQCLDVSVVASDCWRVPICCFPESSLSQVLTAWGSQLTFLEPFTSHTLLLRNRSW